MRVVAYMIRKTLGWCDANGQPQETQHVVSYTELEKAGGGSISNVVCTDNTCRGVGTNSNCVRLVSVQNAAVSDNKCLGG